MDVFHYERYSICMFLLLGCRPIDDTVTIFCEHLTDDSVNNNKKIIETDFLSFASGSLKV